MKGEFTAPKGLQEGTEVDFTPPEALWRASKGNSEGTKGPAEGAMGKIQRPVGLWEATFPLIVEPVAKTHPPVSIRDPLPL